jgi:hypothetical protein
MLRRILVALVCVLSAGCIFDRDGVPASTAGDGEVMIPVFPGGDVDGGSWFLPLPSNQPGAPQPGGLPPIPATPSPAGKVTICHVVSSTPKTIQIDLPALKAHLAHGDHLGPCP